MFFASKLFALATQPLAWVALLFALALLCVARTRTLGLRLGLGWASVYEALGRNRK